MKRDQRGSATCCLRAGLRLAGHELVPAIFGPSGDVKGAKAAPTYSLEAVKWGGQSLSRRAGFVKETP